MGGLVEAPEHLCSAVCFIVYEYRCRVVGLVIERFWIYKFSTIARSRLARITFI